MDCFETADSWTTGPVALVGLALEQEHSALLWYIEAGIQTKLSDREIIRI